MPKAQSSLMEYLIVGFFMLMVIVALMLFLSFWQASQLRAEQESMEDQKMIRLMERVIDSPLMVAENSVFDDAKLMALSSLGQDACQELETWLGRGWSIEIEILNPGEGWSGACDASSYPECTSWLMCPREGDTYEKRAFPVNVYRKPEDRNYLGVLTMWVYG